MTTSKENTNTPVEIETTGWENRIYQMSIKIAVRVPKDVTNAEMTKYLNEELSSFGMNCCPEHFPKQILETAAYQNYGKIPSEVQQKLESYVISYIF